MNPLMIGSAVALLTLIIGVVLGYAAARVNAEDTERLHKAAVAQARADGHRAGKTEGWRESIAARDRAAHAQADMIDVHKRFKALTTDSTELPQ